MNFPCTLQRFDRLPGEYGTLQVNAISPELAEFRLTGEYVQFNRVDAAELVRVLSLWLASVPDATTVVRTHGQSSRVVIENDGPGSPTIEVEDPPPPPGHFGGSGENRPIPPR